MSSDQFLFLLEKFLREELSSDELTGFLAQVKNPENHQLLYKAIGEKLEEKAYSGLSEETDIDEMFEKVMNKAREHAEEKAVVIAMGTKRRLFSFTRIAAASVILVLLAGAFYLLIQKKEIAPVLVQNTSERFKNDVEPGQRGAILTLADGQQIMLDELENGVVAKEGNVDVVKDENGLAYSVGENATVVYNTITTPRGRQFNLVLSDGSRVWLNAGSSITYPTAFMGKERKVSITGEAYFEVSHNDQSQFVVERGSTSVKVFGTHFNVNSYDDEDALMVTLLEGSVGVQNGKTQRIIKPGEQAQIGEGGVVRIVSNVNVNQVVAWKDARFLFESANIKTIMRQVARWYNVEVIYDAEIPYSFVADISMNLPVSSLLELLELTGGVHFKIEEKTITVMK